MSVSRISTTCTQWRILVQCSWMTPSTLVVIAMRWFNFQHVILGVHVTGFYSLYFTQMAAMKTSHGSWVNSLISKHVIICWCVLDFPSGCTDSSKTVIFSSFSCNWILKLCQKKKQFVDVPFSQNVVCFRGGTSHTILLMIHSLLDCVVSTYFKTRVR